MTSKIRVLSDQTINKIAAGEVIENPASVVKELVENSLDADASNICVEIQGGGRELIRVTDNGCGMNQDDALLCLERHATSKIREVDDLQELLTMGFRGEAIPSIAAISKFTLITSPRFEKKEKTEGTIIVIDGGRIVSCSTVPCSPGTVIEVKSLFFNVPVRRKFQKAPASDVQDILKMLTSLALAHPTIQFELISDQKPLLKTKSHTKQTFQSLLERQVEDILGKEFASSMLPLSFQQTPYDMTGLISQPFMHKPNRTGQYLFINNRSVFSPFISVAIREAYGTMLPNNRYPLFVLHLHLPGTLVDVNVHPQKKEVRLRDEFQLKEMIIKAMQTALRKEQQPAPIAFQSEGDPPVWGSYASLLSPRDSSSQEPWQFKSVSVEENAFTGYLDNIKSQPQEKAQTLLFSPEIKPPKVLMTLLGYCILDPFYLDHRLIEIKDEGGLVLLDQQAAYTRIHYEQLLKHSKKESLPLLIPVTLQLTPVETLAVQQYLPLLNEMGFGIREFGEKSIVIDALPDFIKQDQLETCINFIIQDLVEMQTSRHLESKKEEQLALVACRASLPANRRLTIDEAQGLVQRLITCDFPSQCPKGKPTCLYIAPHDIAKWFQKGKQNN